jgi:hypothetical protein
VTVTEQPSETWRQALTLPHLVALGAALLGFGTGVRTTTRQEIDGVLVTCSSTEWGALVVGTVAVLAGTVATVRTLRRTSPQHRPLLLGIAAGSLLLGLVHLARGVGAAGGPC